MCVSLARYCFARSRARNFPSLLQIPFPWGTLLQEYVYSELTVSLKLDQLVFKIFFIGLHVHICTVYI